MKIIFYESTPEDENSFRDIFKSIEGLEMVFCSDVLSDKNISLAKDCSAVSVFIGSKVTAELISQLPNTKIITTRSTGYDHIDKDAAKQKNIVVCNVPAYGSRTVAEFTFALILGLSRKAFLAYRQLKDQHNFDISHFEGFNLQGKTLGVVGTGRIGQNVIKIAKGFEMNVLGFDLFPKNELETSLGFKYSSLNELLAGSDIITLHVPYTKDTHHLINSTNIKSVKPGALLINTARGEVVETDALLYALKHKILSGAGLDVLEGERELKDEMASILQENVANVKILLEDHMLMDDSNVALTPHIAFFTKEAKKEICQTTADNIANFFKNQPQNLVA